MNIGRDVPVETFLKKVKEVETGIVCMSTLMTTTMANMDRVIEELSREGLRDKVKVMVGGGPLSQSYAEKNRGRCIYEQCRLKQQRKQRNLH